MQKEQVLVASEHSLSLKIFLLVVTVFSVLILVGLLQSKTASAQSNSRPCSATNCGGCALRPSTECESVPNGACMYSGNTTIGFACVPNPAGYVQYCNPNAVGTNVMVGCVWQDLNGNHAKDGADRLVGPARQNPPYVQTGIGKMGRYQVLGSWNFSRHNYLDCFGYFNGVWVYGHNPDACAIWNQSKHPLAVSGVPGWGEKDEVPDSIGIWNGNFTFDARTYYFRVVGTFEHPRKLFIDGRRVDNDASLSGRNYIVSAKKLMTAGVHKLTVEYAQANDASLDFLIQSINPTLNITPATASVTAGQTASFVANFDPDGTSQYGNSHYVSSPVQDVTATALWTSSNPIVASVTSAGQIRGLKAGTATITAKYPLTHNTLNNGLETMNGISDTSTITVLQSDLTASAVTPTIATVGIAQTFSSTISNIGTATTGISFPNFFQVATAAAGGGTITDLASSTMTALTNGATNTATSPSYTFPTTGTYSVRACANKSNRNTFGPVSESNTENNCSAWASVVVSTTVQPSVPTVMTPTHTSVTLTSVTLGANVTSLGSPASISARGTCFGTAPLPTTNCIAEGGTMAGVFSHSRTELTAGTKYYYRGYATNATGTGYSAVGTFSAFQNDLTASAVTPTIATVGIAQTFSSTISNIGTATTGISFPNFFQVATAAAGGGTITDLASSTMTALTNGATNTATSPSYTFPTTGTYSVRACANKSNRNTFGPVSESNTENNCGGWVDVNVAIAAVPVVTINASPTSGIVNVINPALTWSATNNPTSCTASGNWSGTKPTSGTNVSQGVLTASKVYKYNLTCSNAVGSGGSSALVIVVPSEAQNNNQEIINAGSKILYSGGEGTILSWSCEAGDTSSVGTNFNTGGASSGSVSINPALTTTYTVTCTPSGRTSQVEVVVKKKTFFNE